MVATEAFNDSHHFVTEGLRRPPAADQLPLRLAKEALWFASVDHLFDLLSQAMHGLALPDDAAAADDAAPLADVLAEMIRRFVRFAAAHPELNQIMVHEATAASDRLTWMTQRHVRPIYDALRGAWKRLRDAGIAAPIDDAMVHYVLVGAASLPYVNAPEARLLTGAEPTAPDWVERHAESLVETLLPARRSAGSASLTLTKLLDPQTYVAEIDREGGL